MAVVPSRGSPFFQFWIAHVLKLFVVAIKKSKRLDLSTELHKNEMGKDTTQVTRTNHILFSDLFTP